jgi:hypothetical protein
LLIAICIVISIEQQSYACDACACSFGGNYVGVLPQFSRSFVGVRHYYRSFNTSGMYNGNKVTANDIFNRTEIWGRYVPHKRIQIFGFLPFVDNTQEIVGNHHPMTVSGLGDALLNSNYTIINTGDSSFMAKQLLLLGLGVKLPTGKFEQKHDNILLHPNLQAGTGSVDYQASIIYVLRYNSFGISTDVSYRFNGINSNKYRFGERFSTNANLFYRYRTGSIVLMPLAGYTYEFAYADTQNNFIDVNTGGTTSLSNLGFDLYLEKFIVNTLVQLPVSYSNIESSPNPRLMLGLSYLF